MPSKYAEDISAIRAGMATLLERSKNTNDALGKLNGTVSKLDEQVDMNCQEIAKLKERQGILAGIQTTLTLIAASVAAWIGTQR